MPRFSVIMASYNNSRYISKAISSVICQTFSDWELIICDDASSDNSSEVIKKYIADPRIKFFSNKINIGYIGTLKKMIDQSSGNILAILDSDDALDKIALQQVIFAYDQHLDVGSVYSQCWYCDEKLKLVHLGFSKKIPEGRTNLHENSIVALRTFKKSAYLKTSGYDEQMLYAEDIDLSLKLEEVTKLYFINKPLYFYRILNNSQTHGFINEYINRSSTALAKYKAYRRRLGTKISNLNKEEIGTIIFYGIISSFFAKRFKLGVYFLSEFIKNFKSIIFSFNFYKYLIKKLYKFLRLEYVKKYS
jgi:glycosyltransferase involved in cell wall biosynthesis